MRDVWVVVVLSSLAPAVRAEPTAPVSAPSPAPAPAPAMEPDLTFGISAFMTQYPTGGFHVAGAYHLAGALYADAQVSLAAHIRTGDSEIRTPREDLWSAQVGASAIRWAPRSAFGVRGSLGYTKYEVEYYDVPEDVTTLEDRDAVYVEVAAFARARLTSRVALEALMAPRFGVTTRDPRLDVSGVLSAGIHVTM